VISKKMVSVKFIVGGAIGLLLLGLLGPIGLDAMESYVPTDPTLAIIWPLTAVFFVLSIGLKYLFDALTD
jgi:hypothetical protein